MDLISSEAKMDRFAIGPSSLLGRSVAVRVLLGGSMSKFRRRLRLSLFLALARLRRTALPLLHFLHPRNTQGLLVTMTLVAFLLRRFTDVQSRAESAYRRKFWRKMMRSAMTYEEWAHAAKMLDKETPRTNDSYFYDEELVRNKLQELRERRQKGSLRDIVFCMRADLLRNLGNMCNPHLHKGRLQVPKLINDYIDEVSTQLRSVCNSDNDDLLLDEKLSFMHETRHAFGRTALLLSGGATLGAFHVGVVRTLVEHKLLPRIIAGSSVGSIVCAIAGTRSDPELEYFFENSLHTLQFFDGFGGVFALAKRIATQGAVHEIQTLQNCLRNITSNMTFQEAYDLTGRILGITVCSPRKHEKPRCLNYLTSPHVFIWSAVTASCAFPGLFQAQELMAKDRYGKLVPYHAPFHTGPEDCPKESARRWVDGSLESDLPIEHLKELFNVNHFIVSQANPHIAPILRIKEFIRGYIGNFAAKLAQLAEMEVKHRCNQVLELGIPIGSSLAKLFAQDWEGDVTIVMPATVSQYLKMIVNPTYMDLMKASNQGRRCTWERLAAIKANCAIELALDECTVLLNHMRRVKRHAERAASFRGSINTTGRSTPFSAHRRIPSWNCIAREESPSSADEGYSSRTPTPYPTMARCRSRRYVQDSSDSESESPSFHSWTRLGGPLARSVSGKSFVSSVQSPESECGDFAIQVDSKRDYRSVPPSPNSRDYRSVPPSPNSREYRSVPPSPTCGEYRSVPPSPTSILVSEGDLLQTARTPNGFVLNVVKKGDLAPAKRDCEQSARDDAEELSDSTHMDCCNGSSGSDCSEDDCPDSNCSQGSSF